MTGIIIRRGNLDMEADTPRGKKIERDTEREPRVDGQLE